MRPILVNIAKLTYPQKLEATGISLSFVSHTLDENNILDSSGYDKTDRVEGNI